MKTKQTLPLTIAGFDPSTGAGLTRDLAVFQEFGLEGISVCTAITYQNNHTFIGVDWLNKNQILDQINILGEAYNLDFVKIGLIENTSILKEVIDLLFSLNKNVKIIWDPILSASAGFVFHKNMLIEEFSFLNKLFLITPNLAEAQKLGLITKDGLITEKKYAILIKSYEQTARHITDLLCFKNEQIKIEVAKIPKGSIHGSGCRLSSAILANLYKNKCLEAACRTAQKYLAEKIEKGLKNL